MNTSIAKELLLHQGLLPLLKRREAEVFLQRLLWAEASYCFTDRCPPEVIVLIMKNRINVNVTLPGIDRRETRNWPEQFLNASKAVMWSSLSSSPYYCSVQSKPRPEQDAPNQEKQHDLLAIQKWLTSSIADNNRPRTLAQWLDQITSKDYIESLFQFEFGWDTDTQTWNDVQHGLAKLTHRTVLDHFNPNTAAIKREYTSDENTNFSIVVCTHVHTYERDLKLPADKLLGKHVLRWWLNHLHTEAVTCRDNRLSTGRLFVPQDVTKDIQERYLAYKSVSGMDMRDDAFHHFAMGHARIVSYPDISSLSLLEI